jgi:hypothetical protein
MLYNFLFENRDKILEMTETKTLDLAGARPSSEQLKRGLPIFYRQLLTVLRDEEARVSETGAVDIHAMVEAAMINDEPAIAHASGHPDEMNLAKSAGGHYRICDREECQNYVRRISRSQSLS